MPQLLDAEKEFNKSVGRTQKWRGKLTIRGPSVNGGSDFVRTYFLSILLTMARPSLRFGHKLIIETA
jgi:hypothetical protein